MVPASVSPTEAVWSAGALLGLLVNLWALRDAYGDLTALREAGRNGARELVARGNIRSEWFRVFVQVCFGLIGLYAMTQLPANPANPVTRVGVALTAALLLAELSVVLSALLDRHERIRLLAYIERQYEDGGC